MGKSPDRGSSPVESLLAERSQFEEWLARLAASDAPDAVRRRVQADYEARLGKVMQSLREHADAIATDLERYRRSLTDLERRQGEAEETVSEAELRHSVGEYTDAKWSEISRVQNASLEGIRSELERVRREIGRLTEVQGSIEGGNEATAPEPAAPAPAPKTAPVPAPAPAAPVRAAEAPAPAKAKVASDDELDFLKSVTVEQASSLSPANATDHQSSSSAEVAPASKAPAPKPEPVAEPVAAAAAPAPAKAAASASGSVKTLKCGECGTLNRPTEWYCERCGAELAAL
ncbi:MAG TPA: zinc finger Ran-binding domain-containing protein [Gemmatimonadales bacterium]|jgi:hypothetical protein|nr:zinc finger Ran-binding domain-containing protein [Gemmatimonadales bacterium]